MPRRLVPLPCEPRPPRHRLALALWPLATMLLASPLLASCAPTTAIPVAGGIGADIAIFHRSLLDMVVSGISGRDCSVVRMDEGRSYCRDVQPPVPPMPYCTRSLGVVDCWSEPELLADHPPEVADGPMQLTAAQNAYRLRRWPGAGRDVLARPPASSDLGSDP